MLNFRSIGSSWKLNLLELHFGNVGITLKVIGDSNGNIFRIKECKRTRGHNLTLVTEQSKLDVGNY